MIYSKNIDVLPFGNALVLFICSFLLDFLNIQYSEIIKKKKELLN